MNTQRRPSGIEGVRDMSWGTHFCMFYQTKDDLLDILIPYFKAGLESHEFCLYVASEPVIAEEAERALREAVPNFERYLAEGQIEIVSHSDWYLSGGHFDPLRVRRAWIDKLNRGLAQGNAGMRFAANTFWLEKEDWDSFAEYEGKVDEASDIADRGPVRFCPGAMFDGGHAKRHPSPSIYGCQKRNGLWEHLESSELKQAHDEIRQLNADLECRVQERTAQLDTTNEQFEIRDHRTKGGGGNHCGKPRREPGLSWAASVADTHILLDRQWRYIYVNEAASPPEADRGNKSWKVPCGSCIRTSSALNWTTSIVAPMTNARPLSSIIIMKRSIRGGQTVFTQRLMPGHLRH